MNKNIKYRKQQKLSKRKVLRFTGFHQNVGKTFAVYTFSCVENAEESHCSTEHLSENFCGSLKSRNAFLSLKLNFVAYGIIISLLLEAGNAAYMKLTTTI